MSTSKKKINAEFFKTKAGNEPVKDELKKLGRPVKTDVGTDIRFVEENWRVDKPYVDKIRESSSASTKTIFEVRHTVENKEYRTFFFVYKNLMVLVHFIHKTSQKTPKAAKDLSWSRMKEWIASNQKSSSTTRKKVAKKSIKKRGKK